MAKEISTLDQTFLQLISLVVSLSNQMRALEVELAALKANLPVHEVKTDQAAD